MKPITRAAARRRAAAEEPQQTIERVREKMRSYLDIARMQGASDVTVPVTHVLDLLDPAGKWSRERSGRREEATAVPRGNADPITGCLPAVPGQGL